LNSLKILKIMDWQTNIVNHPRGEDNAICCSIYDTIKINEIISFVGCIFVFLGMN
jgi:hypothetical protein